VFGGMLESSHHGNLHFFAGVPHVDWEDSTDVPPTSLNSNGTTYPWKTQSPTPTHTTTTRTMSSGTVADRAVRRGSQCILGHRGPSDTTAASTSMYTKGSFSSSSAPENSHTPQQSKVGGDDEAVSTDLSVSPQNGKIVQNSELDPATHVTHRHQVPLVCSGVVIRTSTTSPTSRTTTGSSKSTPRHRRRAIASPCPHCEKSSKETPCFLGPKETGSFF
jgi:hypothetical protein